MILRSLDEILGALERGQLTSDVNEAVREVGRALHAHESDASGSVTLKLVFKSKSEMVTVEAHIDTKMPKSKRRSTSFFLTGDGQLSLNHPQHITLFERSDRRTAVDTEITD